MMEKGSRKKGGGKEKNVGAIINKTGNTFNCTEFKKLDKCKCSSK